MRGDDSHGERANGQARRPRVGTHVVVVEDDPDSREALCTLIETLGFEVSSASDGEAGLALILAELPDVALIDVGLPGLDGYEVARRVRARLGPDDCLLVALTGFGQQADRESALRSGFDEHEVKPIELDRLWKILASDRVTQHS